MVAVQGLELLKGLVPLKGLEVLKGLAMPPVHRPGYPHCVPPAGDSKACLQAAAEAAARASTV